MLKSGDVMLETAISLLMHSILPMLRILPGDSFARPLREEEERECLQRWSKGDLQARNTLVEHNMRLVSHILKKYYTAGEDMDDLVSIGTIGLIKGVNSYQSEKGVRLATYCSRCIENEIRMYFRSRKKNSGDVSLSEALDSEGDGEGLSIMDVLAQEDDLDERVSEADCVRRLRVLIREVLTEREALVLDARYGLSGGDGMTQKECAERLGISRSYVSRIEKHALSLLREALGEA